MLASHSSNIPMALAAAYGAPCYCGFCSKKTLLFDLYRVVFWIRKRFFFFFLVSSTVPRESGLRMLSRASVTLIESRGPGGHLVSCRKQRPGKATLYPVVTQVSSQCWAVLLSCTSTGLERWSNSYEHCAARVGLSTHLQFQHTAEGESL